MSPGPFDPRAPVIAGAGQVVNRPGSDPRSPIALAAEALRLAAEDSGAGEALLRRADSARHVATVSWPYRDEAALIAAEVGASPRETVRTTPFGGDAPQLLVGDTAQAIADGHVDVALVTGAEALNAAERARAGEVEEPWPEQDGSVAPSRVLGEERQPSNEAEIAVGLIAPIFNYALLECAVRARSGATADEHLRRLGELWSRFAEVAAANPHAWLREQRSAEELAPPCPANRLVSSPYTKFLTANLKVDMASALIVCSAEAAQAAGVPRDRWIFVHAGAHAHDEWFLSERRELAASPAIRANGAAALGHAGIGIDDVAHVDLYSCFPSAVQIAAEELGLSLDDPGRPLTVTGGLTFAGGPGNNYSGHAIATLASRLREDPEAFGLVTALGWYATKHALGIYSARPPERPFRNIDARGAMEPSPPRPASAAYSGPATLEAYTVPYGRDGEPEAAIVSAIAPDRTRALARTGDQAVIAELTSSDPLGGEISLTGAGGVAV